MLKIDNKNIEVSIVKEQKGGKILVVENMKQVSKSRAKKPVVELSASLEDYLEKIYLLSSKLKEVRVTDIADELNISKPSVNRAVNSLTAEGLILHAHYGSIELTDSGRKLARAINKKNLLMKQFLMDCLGVDENTATSEANNLKHYIGKSTCKKLSDYLKTM